MSELDQRRLRAPGWTRLHVTRQVARGGLWLMGGLGVSGEENIRGINGPYVQAIEHSSYLDIPAAGVTAYNVDKQQLHYFAKDNLDIPFLGWWLAGGGTMFLDRAVGLTPANHDEIAARAQENAAFAVWPEGHRYRGPVTRERIMRLVIVPMVFEHCLTVVPVGIAGTEPGDLGFVQVAYGEPFTPESIEFEAEPDWEPRKRSGMLAKAIKQQLGKDAIDGFMEDLYQGMSAAGAEARERRRERMARRTIRGSKVVPVINNLSRHSEEKELVIKKS